MPTENTFSTPSALTFADVILFVAGQHSADHGEIAAAFGLTLDQAREASGACELYETQTDTGLWVQCGEDYQGREEEALTEFSGADPHAPIWATAVNPNPHNATTGVEYQGGNVDRLVGAQADGGYPTAQWAGYGQFQAMGRQVRRGESCTRLVKVFDKKDAKGKKKKGVACPRVFNIAQTDPVVAQAPAPAPAVAEVAAPF